MAIPDGGNSGRLANAEQVAGEGRPDSPGQLSGAEPAAGAEVVVGGAPFTLADARDTGISEKVLRRLVRSGAVRSMFYGLYVDAAVPDSIPLRAAAVAKIVPPDAVICRRTAAWLFGVDTLTIEELSELPEVDTVRPTGTRALKLSAVKGHSQTLLPGDVVEWHGLRVTSPIATAVHLGRHLIRPFALSALDSMARAGLIDVPELQEAIRRYPGHPGIAQARQLAAYVDPGAESPGESWLRLRMIDAGFPVPELQVEVGDSSRKYRIDMGFVRPLPHPGQTRLGLEYDSDEWHGSTVKQAADESRARDLAAMGWRIISVRRWHLWGKDPALELAVGDHLGMVPRLPRRW